MARIDGYDFEWSPPSESELKVIEARRERNNKISSLMGQYLLKGYKMLAVTCPACDCVLLEDRAKTKYCVGCSEVDDADTKKDNPAVSEEAARKTVEEIQHRNQPESGDERQSSASASAVSQSGVAAKPSYNESFVPHFPSSAPAASQSGVAANPSRNESAAPHSASSVTSSSQRHRRLSIHGVDMSGDVVAAVGALRDKLGWATTQLQATTSVHEAQTLATLITETCKAITALQQL